MNQITKSALTAVRAHPTDPSSWSALEQAYWDAAHLATSYDSTTGAYSTSGMKLLAKTTDAWQHYIKLTKSPNADVAILAGNAYGPQSAYPQEANAWEYVVQSDPTAVKGYECLAFSAYAAKQTRVGGSGCREGDQARTQAPAVAAQEPSEVVQDPARVRPAVLSRP